MIGSLHRMFWALVLAAGLAVPLASAQALDSGWPRTLPVDAGMVTIYEPQVDGMDGDVIRYRAALAWRPSADAEPIFGAGWFESKVDIDRSQRIVHPQDLKLTNTRFPAGTADLQPGLSAALAEQAPRWNLDYSLDRLDAALEAAATEKQALQQLNTAPPRIIYRDRPALLVQMDGDPVLRTIEDSPYQAVINTPYPLISDGKRYYLNAAKGVWYSAARATGPYAWDPRPPADIVAMVKPGDAGEAEQAPAEPITAANAPEIVVSTEPAELIVTEGPAAFVPLVDDLLVLQNSEDDVFMHVGTQQYYIVLAGRWYRAKSLNGPWAWQAADQLPPAFADIPQNSEQADSRVYVAGTPEAEEAVLDAQLPQTAAVERGPVDIEVQYDGEPDFEPVDGADDLRYAANSGATVLQSDRQYYLVEDGVWYVSNTPNGPWQVAAYRPAAVNTIAPTSPVYNVRYVYIYDRTPSVVYVGYTPGYLGSYVYYNTVVYGTGWHYRPYVSPYYYYPRPSTWGFHVGYNPWGGWSFGLSWNWGWGWSPYYASFYSGGYWHQDHYWHHRHYSYWGPHGYRPRPPRHYRDHYYHGGDRYAYERYDGDRYGDRDRYGDNRGYPGRHDNLYRDSRQRAPVARSRDNSPRQWVRDGKSSERDRYYAGPNKADRQRTQPLKPSDLRMKAQLRDANYEASRKLLVADSSGAVRPVTGARSAKSLPPVWSAKQRSGAFGNDNRKVAPQAGSPVAKQMTAREAIARTDQRQSRFKAPENAKAPRTLDQAGPTRQQKAAPQQKAVQSQKAAPQRKAVQPQRTIPQSGAVAERKAVPQQKAAQQQRSLQHPIAAPQQRAAPPQRVVQQREAPQQKAVQQQRSFQQPKAAPQQRAAPPPRVVQQREAPQQKAVQQQRSFQQPKAAPQGWAAPQQRSAPPQQSAPRAAYSEPAREPRGNDRPAGGASKEFSRGGSRDRRD